jgi:hypothetical protein
MDLAMNAAQKRAVAGHRLRLGSRGLARYEVRGLEQDKELVRELARRLAANDEHAARLRAEVARQIANPSEQCGGILAALLRSPLVGSGLNFEREVTPGRDIKL